MYTRKEILEMLSAGTIDVTRATELLNEVHGTAQASPPPDPAAPLPPTPAPQPPRAPVSQQGLRWLRIHVSDLETGHNRVRVNVPLGLVQLGLKLGARFSDEVDEAMIQDVMDALQSQDITGTLVEVEDLEDNERVHIFVE